MGEQGSIKVLLADDYALVRGMLSELLGREPDVQVVGSVGSSDAAVQAMKDNDVHVVMLDIEMPGMSVFEAAREIRAIHPHVRFLFLSAFAHDVYVAQALEVKAHGYLTKHEPPEKIADAVRRVARGEMCFSKEIHAKLVIGCDAVRLAEAQTSAVSLLSPRELDVIRLIALGRSKKQIAGDLFISVSTVENHTANIMKKLGVHDRVELARLAIREKLVDL